MKRSVWKFYLSKFDIQWFPKQYFVTNEGWKKFSMKLGPFVWASFSKKLSLILRYGGHEKEVRDLALSMGFTNVSLSSEIMAMEKIVPRGYTGKFMIARSKSSFCRLVYE